MNYSKKEMKKAEVPGMVSFTPLCIPDREPFVGVWGPEAIRLPYSTCIADIYYYYRIDGCFSGLLT